MSDFPTRVGVLGGGTMGVGIAHAFLLAGSHVIIVDPSPTAVHTAGTRLDQTLLASVERGRLDNAEPCMQRTTLSTDLADLTDRDLVVEAIPEDLSLKQEVLRDVETRISAQCRLASNTSALSIADLAASLQHPERFLGLHFFNPVPASALVEVVVGPRTEAHLVEVARGWVDRLGKSAVVVQDSPGFASSRLGVHLALEAMRMVQEGVASVEDVDRAMELGYKHPVGPLRTTDIVGLDVRLGIAEHLHATLGDRFTPPQILRDKVARGELGKKSGKGFYDW
ncbi:3-hydroxybutyryl-CoA dehydrogenase [Austwickia sp. TVS 96-490-7B]|uniref:3-hydroxyacyl-CoA dehydrogenase family protein n=1 Tax=Austwickia sp. TVS 96-490-7B TaxID=2830843 RepID=UPI001C574A8F|nr:3-hydroxyacyl-CoA dehydrogenase family protein [Austwickia sp. TVS 96-490-7B]MBW3085273.1 3-hydroxybutyryl-CoA dehydrogenase [Austwickia sp. TVS 96-490-7B]